MLYRLDRLLKVEEHITPKKKILAVNLIWLGIMISLVVASVCVSIWVDARRFIAKKMNIVRIRRETSVLDHLRSTDRATNDSLMDMSVPSDSTQPTLAIDVSGYSSDQFGLGDGSRSRL